MQVATEINVITSNKNHPASISLRLSTVGASGSPSQDNLNLLHLNTSSLRSFSSSLQSLKLIDSLVSLFNGVSTFIGYLMPKPPS